MARPDPHSYADDMHPGTRHVDLVLDVDFSARCLSGTATLQLDDTRGGPLHLDTRSLEILSAVDGKGAPVPFSLDAPDPVLGARLKLDLPAGMDRVTLRYRTSPDASALQWLEPAQTAGGRHPYLFSQCQSIHARSMVPCQDSPRLRVTYKAELNVPAPLVAVMAAAPRGTRPLADGRTAFLFEMPQPIPSYLLALAVGDLQGRDLSPRSRVYAEPAILDAAAQEFSGVEAMITAAEKMFGPYPWERFDMLVMPPSFPFGGMENPRLTFLTPTLLAGDRSLVNVVIHELAHSWTGNLVTNATLEHFWLNEGFTVYAERRILEALEGAEAVALHAAIGLSGLKEDMSRLEGRFTRLQTHLEGVDPDEVYSQVPYEKGCLLLQRIEAAAGRDAFDRFLKTYISTFRFRSITTSDFLGLLKRELPQAARDVNLDRWLHGEGLPDDAAQPRSARLESLAALAQRLGKGDRPDESAFKDFRPNDWQVLLPRIPSLSPADCAWMQERFRLMDSGNMEIRVGFLSHCARAGWAPSFPVVEKTLKGVGRMKYLRPLYTHLKATPEGLALGRRVFQEARAGYHPVARGVMEGLLKSA